MRLLYPIISHLAVGHRALVREELGGFLVLLRLEGREFSSPSAALLDAAEEDDYCDDSNKANDGGDDGNLRTLGKSLPAVLCAVGLGVFLESLGFAPVGEVLVQALGGKRATERTR